VKAVGSTGSTQLSATKEEEDLEKKERIAVGPIV
jgi:hypothetical protein